MISRCSNDQRRAAKFRGEVPVRLSPQVAREPPRHPMPGETDFQRRPVMFNDSLTRSEMPPDIWIIDRKLLETHGCEIEKNEDDGLPQGFFVIAKERYKRTKGHPAIQFR
jgi:hypothetical protein